MQQEASDTKILVVDDNYPAAEMISSLFKAHGYTVECAYNGEEALQKVRQDPPNLILLDVMMPGLNGFEVLKRLKKDHTTADIPTILITAKDSSSDIAHGFEIGADDYLPKPIDPRELLARAKSKLEAYHLSQTLQYRTRDLEALLRVSEELNNQLDINALLDVLIYLIGDLLLCNGVLLRYRHKTSDGGMLQRNFGPENLLSKLTSFVDQVTNQSDLQLQQGVLMNQISIDNNPYYTMTTLLFHGDQFHGSIAVISDRDFKDHNARLLEGIARQATLALRNAESYELEVRYAAELEQKVEERTRELHSAQELLVRSEKLASVGRLAAGIAHEINNPLQPILINLELLSEDLKSNQPVNPQDIEDTLVSARRISRIVERLLQFTRKRGENLPDIELVNTAEVIDNVLALSKKYLQQEKVEVSIDLVKDGYIHGNRDQLEQVFLNLLLNARAALNQGGHIKIQSRLKDDYVLIKVIDNGTGIDPKYLERIFEPFVTTKENGTGLGLFISHEIVQNHNGVIEVKSEIGKGATFTLRFPLAPQVSN